MTRITDAKDFNTIPRMVVSALPLVGKHFSPIEFIINNRQLKNRAEVFRTYTAIAACRHLLTMALQVSAVVAGWLLVTNPTGWILALMIIGSIALSAIALRNLRAAIICSIYAIMNPGLEN